MHIVSFIVALVFILVSIILFLAGLVRLHRNTGGAEGLITGGFTVGLLGVVASAVIFGFFTL